MRKISSLSEAKKPQDLSDPKPTDTSSYAEIFFDKDAIERQIQEGGRVARSSQKELLDATFDLETIRSKTQK